MLLLFTYPDYYPSGGAEDLTAIVDSIDQACRFIVTNINKIRTTRSNRWSTDNAHIFDTETGEITKLSIELVVNEVCVKSCTITVGVTMRHSEFRSLGVE